MKSSIRYFKYIINTMKYLYEQVSLDKSIWQDYIDKSLLTSLYWQAYTDKTILTSLYWQVYTDKSIRTSLYG